MSFLFCYRNQLCKFLAAVLLLSLSACVSPQIKHQTNVPATNAGKKQNPAETKPNSSDVKSDGAATPSSGASAPSFGTSNQAPQSGQATAPGQELVVQAPPPASGLGPAPLPVLVRPPIPRIGLILGPGGAKTYAHLAFLQELVKSKVPIHSVVGIEFAAPIAALFSRSNSANDVEWQMFKFKDDDFFKKSILGVSAKAAEASLMSDSLRTIFQDQKAESGRIPFMCPSLNLQKGQQFWMNRGLISQLLPYCMAYPPLFKPYQGSIASTRDVKAAADYLRKLGANVVVFVNVLSAPYSGASATEESIADEVMWSELSYLYKSPGGAELVLNLETNGFGVGAFAERREIFQEAKDSATKAVGILTKKLDL